MKVAMQLINKYGRSTRALKPIFVSERYAKMHELARSARRLSSAELKEWEDSHKQNIDTLIETNADQPNEQTPEVGDQLDQSGTNPHPKSLFNEEGQEAKPRGRRGRPRKTEETSTNLVE